MFGALCVLFFLFKNATPISYTVIIRPNVNNLNFDGYTMIDFAVDQPTTELKLHASSLSFTDVLLIRPDNSYKSYTKDVLVDQEKQTIVIPIPEGLATGSYGLKFEYTGIINKVPEGLYWYQNADSNFILTDLSKNQSREVFPCFSTTELITFSLQVIISKEYSAVFNSKVIGTQALLDGNVTHTFEPVYQIAASQISLVLTMLEAVRINNLNVYAASTDQSTYVIDLFKNLMSSFENYPSLNKPLAKLDVIIVPDGALAKHLIENPGILLYRESALPFRESLRSTKETEELHQLVAHSIATQYLNYSQVESPLDFVLLEALAIYYQLEVIDAFDPAWRIWQQFVVDYLHKFLEEDVIEKLNSIRTEAHTDELMHDFYLQTAFILRMLKKSGASDYIEVKSLANKTSYPIVFLERNYETSDVIFLKQFSIEQVEDTRTVPVNYASQDDPNFSNIGLRFILSDRQIINTQINNGSWIIANLQQIGYYRVNYDEPNWNLIIAYLKNGSYQTIHPVNRAQLIDDAFNLAKLGNLSYEVVLNLLDYASTTEDDYIPLVTFFKTMTKLKLILGNSEEAIQFTNYLTDKAKHIYTNLKSLTPFETAIDRLHRIQVRQWFCSIGYNVCLEDMYREFSTFTRFHPDLDETIYCGGLRFESNLPNFIFVASQYQTFNNLRALRALGCSTNAELINKYYLPAILDQSQLIRLGSSDKLTAFSAIYDGSVEGIDLALDYVKANFNEISLRLDEYQVLSMIRGLSTKLYTLEQKYKLSDILADLTETNLNKFASHLKWAIKTVEENILKREEVILAVYKWLDEIQTTTLPSSTEISSISTDSDSTTISPPAPTTHNITTTTKSPGSGSSFFPNMVLYIFLNLLLYFLFEIQI